MLHYGKSTLRHHLENKPKGLSQLPQKAKEYISTRAEEKLSSSVGQYKMEDVSLYTHLLVYSFDSDGILHPHRILYLVAIQAFQ